ncbi:hypothetical protein OBV_28980 [Oscillibacter valericigenes Sjm18-20]|nr:hypothetical protein OBV_28980 [Oscillibacter valericigenes Sjm18-20]
MKHFSIKIGLYFLTILLILSGLYLFGHASKDNSASKIRFSYFEDAKGHMEFSGIESAVLKGEFVQVNDGNFTFGRSHSAFWIRILPEDAVSLKEYIALFCPNIQNVRLYIPTETGYDVHYSGWANSFIRDDEGLTYPVFRLDPNIRGEKPIYMRIESCYSHNYTLEFYSQKELNQVWITEFCLNSFFFGMLITVVIINLIIFYKLKNKTCLAFSLCVLLLTLNQGCSYGMYNLILPAHSYLLMSLSIEIGLLFIISVIVFFIIFSDIKTRSKLYYRCLLLSIAACLLGFPICLVDKVAANLYSHLLTIIIPSFILYLFFKMYRTDHHNQLFLIGWGLTILLYAGAMLVCEGIIQIGFSTFHLPTELIVMLTVSMLFTVAITERARRLQLESQQMQQQYQAASERIKWTETALLQTQIKPHFLYNTLTAIEQLCETDSQKAQGAIADFAAFLRSNIDFSTETQLIRIEQELSNVKHYLSLEQMRFEERLKVVYDIQAGGFLVPPLVVQPMVENAVRHGVTKRPEGGTITISILDTPADYVITVTDDGVGFDPDSDTWAGKYHIGIDNARERMRRQCGGALHIDSKIGVGTVVTMSIPKRENV